MITSPPSATSVQIYAFLHERRHGVAIATIALINTAVHAGGAVLTQSYAPGLVSAVVLYVPIGSLLMIRAFEQAPRAQVLRGIIAGIMLHALVFIVAFLSAYSGSP